MLDRQKTSSRLGATYLSFCICPPKAECRSMPCNLFLRWRIPLLLLLPLRVGSDDVAYKERHVILPPSPLLALGHEYQSNGREVRGGGDLGALWWHTYLLRRHSATWAAISGPTSALECLFGLFTVLSLPQMTPPPPAAHSVFRPIGHARADRRADSDWSPNPLYNGKKNRSRPTKSSGIEATLFLYL